MSITQQQLRVKAQELELEGLQKNKINQELLPTFVELLCNFYATSRPKEKDYYNRKDLVRIFNVISKELFGKCDDCPVVEGFGSFTMDIFSDKSDLDLSVTFGDNAVAFPRDKKIKTLKKFAEKFNYLQCWGHVSGIKPILSAKVPVLKVTDCGTGIECDISVENREGVAKSKIFRLICSIDERFQMLSFLTKAWAKAHGINSSKDKTLNSLSIISLVAFHLQTRDPPILPPFSAILKDGSDPSLVGKLVTNFSNYGERNQESLGVLFVTLLIKLASVETLWPKGLCASIFEGAWILKTWGSKSKCGIISVEDITNRSENVARAVGSDKVKKIYQCIHFSLQNICFFMNGKIQATKLQEVLFGREDAVGLVSKYTSSTEKRTLERSNNFEPMMKKMCPGGSLEGITMQPMPLAAVLETIAAIKNNLRVVWGGTPTNIWPSTNSPAMCSGTQKSAFANSI